MIGFIGLLLVTCQLLGAFVALMVVAAIHNFPDNFHTWISWTRLGFLSIAIVMLLLIVGKPRSRIQLMMCTVTISLACVMIATLA